MDRHPVKSTIQEKKKPSECWIKIQEIEHRQQQVYEWRGASEK